MFGPAKFPEAYKGAKKSANQAGRNRKNFLLRKIKSEEQKKQSKEGNDGVDDGCWKWPLFLA